MQKQISNYSSPVQFFLLCSKYFVLDCSQQKKSYTTNNAIYPYMPSISSLIYFVKIVHESIISQGYIQNLANYLIWNFFQK